MTANTVKFTCVCKLGDNDVNVEWDLATPIQENLKKLPYLMIDRFNLIDKNYDEIYSKLTEFVKNTNKNIYFNAFDEYLAKFNSDTFDQKSLVSYWSEKYNSQCIVFASNIPKFDDILNFSDKFKSLLNGGSQKILVKIISDYRVATDNLILQKNELINSIKNKYLAEINDYKKSDEIKNKELIEMLTNQCYEETQKIKNNYNDLLIQQEKLQRTEFREWVLKTDNSYDDILQKKESTFKPQPNLFENRYQNHDGSSVDARYESYSVKFGFQLKCTHNINISCKPIKSFIAFPQTTDLYEQLLLQNMFSLYSDDLHALILFTSDEIPSKLPCEKMLTRCSLTSTEFHFQKIDEQIQNVKNEMASSGINKLEQGDCYITVHSNLSKANVVFHIVHDLATIESFTPSLQHPIVNGIFNMLEHCFLNGISTITIPILCVDKLTETMDHKWCIRRADCMLKSLKAIILQTTPFHLTPRVCTINLLLPETTSIPIFEAVCNLVQQNYTQTGTLDLSISY